MRVSAQAARERSIIAAVIRCAAIIVGCAGIDIPVIVRLSGTNVEEGQRILGESGLPIIRAGTLMEAAERSVQAWKNDVAARTALRRVS